MLIEFLLKIPVALIAVLCTAYLVSFNKWFDTYDAECVGSEKQDNGKFLSIYQYYTFHGNIIEPTFYKTQSITQKKPGSKKGLLINKKFPKWVTSKEKHILIPGTILLVSIILLII